MTHERSRGLRELEEWLRASVADAERRLPALLDLPPAVLRRELDTCRELRTAGMMQRLIALAAEAVDRYPLRAHELTSIVVEYTPFVEARPDRTAVLLRLQAQGWKEHARAANALGRTEEARAALATARRLFEQTPINAWYLATVDLVEAPLLYDAGEHAQALALVRGAASEFALHHDYEHLVEARMLETWMHWSAGNDDAATEVWTATAELAQQRGHRTLLARLTARIGVFQLRHGNPETASRLLTEATQAFEEEGLTREAVRTRWHLAEAATARRRLHEAISEYYKVRATLLATGSVVDAAIASAEIVELLLLAARDTELPSVTASFVDTFRPLLPLHALEAFTYLSARAARGDLTREDAAAVRRYFEDLPQMPQARFRAGE
jgi:tetratricopeptide (TPR) repeat protein